MEDCVSIACSRVMELRRLSAIVMRIVFAMPLAMALAAWAIAVNVVPPPVFTVKHMGGKICMYSAMASAWYMIGSAIELQVMRPSTSDFLRPASSNASRAASTQSSVGLLPGTTPTSVSAAPTIAI